MAHPIIASRVRNKINNKILSVGARPLLTHGKSNAALQLSQVQLKARAVFMALRLAYLRMK